MTEETQPTASPDDEPTPTSKERRRVGCLAAFIALVVYSLSAFPMSWLARQVNVPFFNRALETFYLPLIYAVKIFYAIF